MDVPEWMREFVTPYILWQAARRKDPGPPPPEELGRNLDSLEDVSIWLSHPSNWFDGDLDIIKWNGVVPTISTSRAWQIAPGCYERDMMLRVVLQEQIRRKRGKANDEVLRDSRGDLQALQGDDTETV